MKKLVIASALAVLVAAGNAGAVSFSGTATGTWSGADPESSGVYTIAGDDNSGVTTIKWGTPGSTWFWETPKTQSSLSFDGAGTGGANAPAAWDSASIPFILGKLDFHNGAIQSGTGITGADLNILVDIVNPTLGTLGTFTYGLGIQNTVNPAGDTVLVLNAPGSVSFDYQGWEYTFGLLGFSANGDSFSDRLFASEESSVCTKIWGTVSGRQLPNNVPDGGSTLILVGMAMTGLAFLRSKMA
jgi:hypothetical protein